MKKFLVGLITALMLFTISPAIGQNNCPSLSKSPTETRQVLEDGFDVVDMFSIGIFDPNANKDNNRGTEGEVIESVVIIFEPLDSNSCYSNIGIALRADNGQEVGMFLIFKYGQIVNYRFENGNWIQWGEPETLPGSVEI